MFEDQKRKENSTRKRRKRSLELKRKNVSFRVQDTRGGELCSYLIFANSQSG